MSYPYRLRSRPAWLVSHSTIFAEIFFREVSLKVGVMKFGLKQMKQHEVSVYRRTSRIRWIGRQRHR